MTYWLHCSININSLLASFPGSPIFATYISMREKNAEWDLEIRLLSVHPLCMHKPAYSCIFMYSALDLCSSGTSNKW